MKILSGVGGKLASAKVFHSNSALGNWHNSRIASGTLPHRISRHMLEVPIHQRSSWIASVPNGVSLVWEKWNRFLVINLLFICDRSTMRTQTSSLGARYSQGVGNRSLWRLHVVCDWFVLLFQLLWFSWQLLFECLLLFSHILLRGRPGNCLRWCRRSSVPPLDFFLLWPCLGQLCKDTCIVLAPVYLCIEGVCEVVGVALSCHVLFLFGIQGVSNKSKPFRVPTNLEAMETTKSGHFHILTLLLSCKWWFLGPAKAGAPSLLVALRFVVLRCQSLATLHGCWTVVQVLVCSAS